MPGVRENGGQYTHAAVWAAMAFAALGDARRAWELLRLINPLNHVADAAKPSARYKVEPYVVAADVYAVAPHTGRGGWTWYTGSAGWMYRLIVESLLGLRRRPTRCSSPRACGTTGKPIPCATDSATRTTASGSRGRRPRPASPGSVRSSMGVELGDGRVPLVDDHVEHDVEVIVSPAR